MKTIGLIGGMSWESSIEYEKIINTEVRQQLGGTSSADLIIRSYNFAEIEEMQEAGDWDAAGDRLATDARHLERAGAEAIAICTNTMHKVADVVEMAIGVPLIHIADATAVEITSVGINTVAVLGTRYTMEQAFYVERLGSHGLTTIVPDETDRTMINTVIFEELVRGEVRDSSKAQYREAVAVLIDRGAEGVVAGCTEIELLIDQGDVPVPFFPSAAIHARSIADFSLG
ncbi:MAG: aspartate/glutamate racemase family protein [Actinomycetia bacterium]|nr:aspartate/glutamate racemase family protein [Actinomycetes bacterium]